MLGIQRECSTLGDHPQHILNKEIIETSDLLVAIFWSKLGHYLYADGQAPVLLKKSVSLLK